MKKYLYLIYLLLIPSLSGAYTITKIDDFRFVDINDKGQMVLSKDSDLFFWDNGNITQITDNEVGEYNVRLNNRGQVVWEREWMWGLRSSTYPWQDEYWRGAFFNNVQLRCRIQPAACYRHKYLLLWDNDTRKTKLVYHWWHRSRWLWAESRYHFYPILNDRGEITWHESLIPSWGLSQLSWLYYDDGSLPNPLLLDVLSTFRPYGMDMNNYGDVVWAGFDGQDWEIFLWDNESRTITQITDNSYQDYFPLINDRGDMAWIRDGTTIFYWDGNDTTRISSGRRPSSMQLNNRGEMVWYAYDNSDIEIYFWDGIDVIKLTDNSSSGESGLHMNDRGEVVWSDVTYDPLTHVYNREIFYWNSNDRTVIQLTDNDYLDILPNINNFGWIAWTRISNGDSSVYLAVPDPAPVPEPSTLLLLGSGLFGLAGLRRFKGKAR